MADDKTTTSAVGLNVLVVEDDAVVASGLVSYLRDIGAEVTWCSNVAEAAEAIDRLMTFQVAIIDYNLDGEPSTPILDKLRNSDVFTVLCTGYDVSSIDERFWSLPRVEKPFTRRALRALLSSYQSSSGS